MQGGWIWLQVGLGMKLESCMAKRRHAAFCNELTSDLPQKQQGQLFNKILYMFKMWLLFIPQSSLVKKNLQSKQ